MQFSLLISGAFCPILLLPAFSFFPLFALQTSALLPASLRFLALWKPSPCLWESSSMPCQPRTEAGCGLAPLHAGYTDQGRKGTPLDCRHRWSWGPLGPQEAAELPVITQRCG